MYNDVDMVWFGDPFCYLEGNHDVYFSDDMAAVCGFIPAAPDRIPNGRIILQEPDMGAAKSKPREGTL
ncbi:hypothetical protein Goshw_005981 [Gossypium schwendimanii]|uniref:Nucleotide-diphospho-sugar transferase domain-containing protein n=1 Tax=Gossypium schwendimanii TaxID=34291 RepID=A0A7J9NGW5_GOSSC|nr:hypothetical protein [Gossypium schwendimanii]